MPKIEKLTLMNKNKPIIDFDYDTEFNIILDIYHNYTENERYAPLSIKDLKLGINRKNLMDWFKNRIIPETRDGINEYLKKYKNDYNLFMIDIISRSHGLNLSDQYWIKLPNENCTWEEINYFTNDFDDIIGKKIVSKNTSSNDIPNSSTNGNLYKKWIILENNRYLIKGSSGLKQEPYNEVIATKLYERILSKNEYVKYELYKKNNSSKIFSKCKCFITENTELVPAWDIIKVLKQRNDENDYVFFLKCCEYLKIPNVKDYMNKLLTCDYILANSDRHYNNFGAIRNVETLEYIGMSPIFDTGNSLGIIRNNENILTSAPFYKKPKKQLELVDDLTWLDINKLKDFEIVVKEELKLNDTLSDKYIEKQILKMNERIEGVIEYKEKLEKQ